MGNGMITVDPQDLKDASDGYAQAGARLVAAEQTISGTAANPNFGLVMQPIKPAYLQAREATKEYLDALGDTLNILSQRLLKAADAFEQTEQDAIDKIKELQGEVDGVDTSISIGDGGNGGNSGGGAGGGSDSGGGTGTGVGGGTGAGSGSGGGGVSVGTPAVPGGGTAGGSGSDGGASGGNTGGSTAGGFTPTTPPIAGSGVTPDGTDGQNGTGTKPGLSGQNTDRPDQDGGTAGAGDETGGNVYVDVDGDGQADYSIHVTPGTNLSGTVSYDSSGARVELGKEGGSTSPAQAGQSGVAGQSSDEATLSLDTDGDGTADMDLSVESDRDSLLSFRQDASGRYVAVDFDHDGDMDARYAVPDDARGDDGTAFGAAAAQAAGTATAPSGANADRTAAAGQAATGQGDGASQPARTTADDETERLAWDIIAKDDPLGRSGEELRQLFEDRDPITFDDDDTLGGANGSGANDASGFDGAATPVQTPLRTDGTAKGGNGSWIAY